MQKPHRRIMSGLILAFIAAVGILLFNSMTLKENSILNRTHNSPAVSKEIKVPLTAALDNKFIQRKKTDDKADNNQNWFSEAQKKIKEDFYKIEYKDNVFQAGNPAQNLKFTYSGKGFSVRPQSTKIPGNMEEIEKNPLAQIKYKQIENWNIGIQTTGYGKGHITSIFSGKDFVADKNLASVEDNNFKISYCNDENGMRQDFTVKNRPYGDGMLKVGLAVNTRLKTEVSKEEISFSSASGEKMKYNGLKVTDASGKELEAWFEEVTQGKEIAIAVNDLEAEYPVIIDPISTTPSYTLVGTLGSGGFGYSVSTAGDVDKNGYSDVIVGAPQDGIGSGGKVYLYRATASGLPTTASWSYACPTAYANLGNSVACAGDVNGDGYSDVIIGAANYPVGASPYGAVYVFYGSSSGLRSTPDWSITGSQSGASFGCSVASAGDVNGDGYDDVIIGAYLSDNTAAGKTDAGKVFVYYGSASGLSNTPAWTKEGDQAGGNLGNCVASAGDVNKDGYDDVIIGANMYDNPETDEGKAYLYLSSASGLASTAAWTGESNNAAAYYGASVACAGDVNRDGFSDVIVSAYSFDGASSADIGKIYVYYGSPTGIPANPSWSIEGWTYQAQFGMSVASAGDVNGDGYSDIIIGSRTYANGQPAEGAAFIYYGSVNGIITPYKWMYESNIIQGFLGKSVSSAGDINRDGYSDVIVGCAGYVSSGKTMGAAYVFLGADDPTPVELTSFTSEVSNRNVILKWKTATEINNYGFEIQRKQTGLKVQNSDWEKIGFVSGHGNSNSPHEYTFTDKNVNAGKYLYRLKQLDYDGTLTHSFEVEAEVKYVKNNLLLQNYPNPFNPFTKISYSLQSAGKVRLTIYDMLGKEVSVLVNESQDSGLHDAVWNAADAKSGVYLYVLEYNSPDGKNSFKSVQKMIYMK